MEHAKVLWGEAVHTVVFLLNRAPTSALDGLTSYQAWYKKKPSVHFLKVLDVGNAPKHLEKVPGRLRLVPCLV